MPRYFTTISSLNNPKNKLEAAMQSFFKNNSNRILNSTEAKEQLQSDIHHMNVRYNKEHNRCKSFTISSHMIKDARTYYLPGGMFTITKENTYGKET